MANNHLMLTAIAAAQIPEIIHVFSPENHCASTKGKLNEKSRCGYFHRASILSRTKQR
jgi:hypothetical protein